ncbi:MAG: DUF1848 domain-containing protein [Deltaproteobacteria bacterium]|nr:DUF1848 domain-containing protein [Deltaproteobacteria bacterium]
MIVSASRRTDVPALYPEWLAGRLAAGFAAVPHPFDPRRLRRVDLRPAPEGELEALVLWTRNPSTLLAALPEWEARGVRTLWLVTITGYPRALEPAAPSTEAAVAAVRALARRVGPDRVAWRYDPVLVCPAAGLDGAWHRRNIRRLAAALDGSTRRCIVSLYDDYAKARRRLAAAGFVAPLALDGADARALEETLRLAADLAAETEALGIRMQSCCEELVGAAIGPGACIDAALLAQVWGLSAARGRDPGQRPACRCAPSVDLGVYDTCVHGCLYCYATGSPARAAARRAAHEPTSERLS